jgi:hypothetical protein
VFETFLRTDWLLERVTGPVEGLGLRTSPEVEAAFRSGTINSWKNRGLAADYLGDHFKFLRVHTLGGRSGLLFRVAGDKGRLNYCLLTLAMGADGIVTADDVFVVGVGEFVSDTLRRGYLLLVESLHPVSASGRRAALYVEHLPQIIAVNEALAIKDYRSVIELTERLPVALRQERSLLLMRLEAAEHTSLAERTRVFDEWRALHPDALGLPLKFADFHIATGQFEDADRVLTQLNAHLGGDAYLRLRIGEARVLQRHIERLRTAGPAASAPADAEASARIER